MDDDVDADGNDRVHRREPGSPHDQNGDGARGRERRWLFWFFLVAFAVVLMGAAFGVVAARADDPDEPLGAGAWALIIGVPVADALVAAALGAVFVFWRRRRGSALFARSPLWELPTQKQRRQLVRALRRGRPIDPDRHDLALRTASDITRRRGLVWLYLGLVVLQAGNVAIQDGWGRWLYLLSGLIFLVLAGYWAWLVRRMRLAVRRLERAVPDGGSVS